MKFAKMLGADNRGDFFVIASFNLICILWNEFCLNKQEEAQMGCYIRWLLRGAWLTAWWTFKVTRSNEKHLWNVVGSVVKPRSEDKSSRSSVQNRHYVITEKDCDVLRSFWGHHNDIKYGSAL